MPEDEDDDDNEDDYDSDEGRGEWAAGDDLDSGLHAVMDQDWADAAGGEHSDITPPPLLSTPRRRTDALRRLHGVQTLPSGTTG